MAFDGIDCNHHKLFCFDVNSSFNDLEENKMPYSKINRSQTHKIHEWWKWVEICAEADMDPYENVDLGYDIGGGDSIDYEYVGDMPERSGHE